jgi:hypothetical protein
LEVDVEASGAYCRALLNAGVISSEDATSILEGLERFCSRPNQILLTFSMRTLKMCTHLLKQDWSTSSAMLVRSCTRGAVATIKWRPISLWVRNAIDSLQEQLRDTQTALLDFAQTNRSIVIPATRICNARSLCCWPIGVSRISRCFDATPSVCAKLVLA